jgi:hypothetical protein
MILSLDKAKASLKRLQPVYANLSSGHRVRVLRIVGSTVTRLDANKTQLSLSEVVSFDNGI